MACFIEDVPNVAKSSKYALVWFLFLYQSAFGAVTNRLYVLFSRKRYFFFVILSQSHTLFSVCTLRGLSFLMVFISILQLYIFNSTDSEQLEARLHDYKERFSVSLQKQAYSNILKILPPQTENFQIKSRIFFSNFCSNHKLWVLVGIALARRF